ncbi:D-2-hydroxyacid dehydrogenase [Paenarthrobacter aromaticivorans]|uniref:D-2-hydroxyacid dehydrogenase n=1 Tax=Paenarthrobacter aromaticivorans TaxID=2849150 RepID=UPI003A801B53
MDDASESREIRSVLATVLYQPDEIEQLRRAFAPAKFVHVHPRESAAIEAALEHADVAILPMDLDERFIAAPNLKWVHCDHAGLTKSARSEVFERGLIVTGSAGRSAPALAQHAFYFALALTFDAKRLFELQAARTWTRIPGYENRLALWGKTLGVVGFGNTGKEMAHLGKAFGMRVMAYRRSAAGSSPDVDVMLSKDNGDSLESLIEESDVIMLATPLSDETRHLFGAPEFASMKDTAYLINMARGGVVDQDALIKALETGQIAGAGLDVTDPEPLPADSPLWGLDNVVITPHVTPKLPDRTQRSIDTIVDNIGRYRRGEQMLNALTPRDIFTPLQPSPHP